MATLYLDLDGTLVNVRRRYYFAYADALRELGMTPRSEHDYWACRREGAASADLVGAVDEACRQRFLSRWLARVESPAYLRLDTLVPGTRETLISLLEFNELVLVTLRRERTALMEQLSELTLGKFFSAVYSRDDSLEVNSKAELIRLLAKKVARDSVVVGDSEADVQTARALGLVSVCVTNGLRGRRFLERVGPDHLIPSITRLPKVLPAP